MKTRILAALFGVLVLASSHAVAQQPAQAGAKKPNIVVIMGDDIGINNVSAYGQGVVGYRTPNIDRLTGRCR